ncbi:hypothetical protein IC607_08545 [Cellulomonas sp. JH27-2]|uniref:hypothetical protein n=1 Tax=Cellulomonas sp. JH27-2 TaxID=2774139 RepID=UPI00177D36FD|nr:hypothetical protein [Cellulomonas sp. JH27-2]MBD8059015.1 hypothetical protein [Cellulomonas sp. JH27-2]
MQLWDARFRDHELWRVVEQARSTMNAVALPDGQPERDMLDYAGMVLELLERRREDTDGREVSPSMLVATQSAASNFATTLGYVQTGQYTWQQVVPAVDDVVTALGQWPPLKLSRYMSGISAAADSFQQRVLNAADAVEVRAEEIRSSLETIASKQAEVEAAVTNEKQRITEAIATFTSTGNEAIREWTQEHDDAINERAAVWDAALAAAQNEADEHRERMSQYEDKSRKVLEAVGVNSTATDFGQYAKEQGEAADTWRQIAALVFVVAGGWFIASSFPWFTDGADLWESAVARLGVTAAVAGVGAYAARESSQHRKEARRAKLVQLVLTALEPFLANLPAEMQDEIRAEAARSIFVLNAEATVESESADGYLEVMKSLVGKLPERG